MKKLLLCTALLSGMVWAQEISIDSVVIGYVKKTTELFSIVEDYPKYDSKIRNLYTNQAVYVSKIKNGKKSYQPSFYYVYFETDSGFVEKENLILDEIKFKKLSKNQNFVKNNRFFSNKNQSNLFNKTCDNIQHEYDEFENENIYRTSTDKTLNQVTFIKYVKNGKSNYYLKLKAHGASVVVDGIGAQVIFKDKSKWSKNVKIDVDVSYDYDGYEYTAFIPLSSNDIQTFKSKEIEKFRLYIFDSYIINEDGKQFQEEFNCLLNKK